MKNVIKIKLILFPNYINYNYYKNNEKYKINQFTLKPSNFIDKQEKIKIRNFHKFSGIN